MRLSINAPAILPLFGGVIHTLDHDGPIGMHHAPRAHECTIFASYVSPSSTQQPDGTCDMVESTDPTRAQAAPSPAQPSSLKQAQPSAAEPSSLKLDKSSQAQPSRAELTQASPAQSAQSSRAEPYEPGLCARRATPRHATPLTPRHSHGGEDGAERAAAATQQPLPTRVEPHVHARHVHAPRHAAAAGRATTTGRAAVSRVASRAAGRALVRRALVG
jgi:hypothetical protein